MAKKKSKSVKKEVPKKVMPKAVKTTRGVYDKRGK